MERKLEQIASEALQMSVESRAALAKRLLDSLDELAPDELEVEDRHSCLSLFLSSVGWTGRSACPPLQKRMWVDEAARRYQQLKAGTANSIASEEVFARLDARPRR